MDRAVDGDPSRHPEAKSGLVLTTRGPLRSPGSVQLRGCMGGNPLSRAGRGPWVVADAYGGQGSKGGLHSHSAAAWGLEKNGGA